MMMVKTWVALSAALLVSACDRGGDDAPDPGAGAADVFVSSTSVRLLDAKTVRSFNGDGLGKRPIPRRVQSVVLGIEPPITDPVAQEIVADLLVLVDAHDKPVAGTYSWSTDGAEVSFLPSRRFAYGVTYTLTLGGVIGLVGPVETSFTVMQEHDVNGDGYADLMVGAAGSYQAPGSYLGTAYLFTGGVDGIASCDLGKGCAASSRVTAATPGTDLARRVEVVGDVNADGYSDVVVGASRAEPSGVAYVFLGSPGGVGTCNLGEQASCEHLSGTLVGPTIPGGGGFGLIASSAGDLNGDGFDDIMFGESGGGGGLGTGWVFIFQGSASGIGNCDISKGCQASTYVAGPANAGLGRSARALGDVNGDGFDDVALGAASIGSQPGQAFIFFGRAGGLSNCDMSAGCLADRTFTGEAAGNGFGGSLAASDFDGDGHVDLVVGATTFGGGGVGVRFLGRAYIFSGTDAGPVSCDLGAGCRAATTFGYVGASASAQLGTALAATDLNGDANADLVLTDALGRAYVFFGTASGIPNCSLGASTSECPGLSATVVGPYGAANYDALGVALDEFGQSAQVIGDVNHDGYPDIALGAVGADLVGVPPTAVGPGKAYVLLGGQGAFPNCALDEPGECVRLDSTLTGAQGNTEFGSLGPQ